MASDVDDKNTKDIQLLKRTRISVFVDEALPDILVVTYEFGVKIFKGVLLDSTKRNLPCGIEQINPAFTTTTPADEKQDDDDNLYAVNQRFAYMDPNKSNKRKNIQLTNNNKLKNNKMTVRLRPRQVLCSKCKDICNENSENVSRKRKLDRNHQMNQTNLIKRDINAPITRSVVQNLQNNSINCDKQVKNKRLRLNPDNNETQPITNTDLDEKQQRALRKKRTSVGSMEDLWDESVFEDPAKKNNEIQQPRTIKISYGRQGEGTVLKIPTTSSTEACNNDDEENLTQTIPNKAARRALKRAKKEARRKILLNSSPLYLGNCSPRYMGNASPRHSLSNSPRYLTCSYDFHPTRRRKHKMKHKKRHRDDKEKTKYSKDNNCSVNDDLERSKMEENKEQCITQKLSINLKRLNNTYTYLQSNAGDSMVENVSNSSSDEQNDSVPDFPPPSPPLMLRINAQTQTSAPGADGVRLLVGDVVWGKIHGFPWWPGKILTITSCGTQSPQAHVAWYGSSTSSLMQCDQLSHYLDNFKSRYNKKKKGPYKEAVKQATSEARENAENRIRQPLGNSPSHNIIQQVVPPALASPREIDVVS